MCVCVCFLSWGGGGGLVCVGKNKWVHIVQVLEKGTRQRGPVSLEVAFVWP